MIIFSKRIKKDIFQRFPVSIWLIVGLQIFISMSFTISLPFLALYLHNERNLLVSLIGVIFLIGGICTSATNIIGGMLSDNFGRRRLLLMSSSMGVLGYLLLSWLVGISAPIWMIALAYITARGVVGTIQPCISAMIADLTPRDRLTETYSLIRVGSNLGFSLGPAIGGALMVVLSYNWLLSISALICLVFTILVYFFLKETFQGRREVAIIRNIFAVTKDKVFFIFILCSFLWVLSEAHMWNSTLSIFTVNWLNFSTVQYGLLLTINCMMVVLLQYPATFLFKKIPRTRGLILGSLLNALGFFTLGWFSSFSLVILSIVIITIGEIIFNPIASSVVAETAPPHKRGIYLGFFALTQTFSISLAPLIGGILLDLFPYEPRLLWGVISLTGLFAAAGFYRWGKIVAK